MKLQKVSSAAGISVIGALVMSLFLMWNVYTTHQREVLAEKNRQQSIETVINFRESISELNRLVKAYISTADPQYLLYYYELLAIENGIKQAPKNYDPSIYWYLVLDNKIKHQSGVLGGSSFVQKMKEQGFSQKELNKLDEIYKITEELKKLEQIAFAATQGLYDVKNRRFVDDGVVDLQFASSVVYGKRYITLSAELYKAIEELIRFTNERTQALLEDAELDLRLWLLVSILFMSVISVLTVSYLIAVQKLVIKPIATLTDVSRKISHGEYVKR